MLFEFAGSTHHKYTQYILEMICNVELESSPELRKLFFENWLVNPSGLPGHWMAGDLYQEQLQDELYEHIGRKDAGFDQSYVQEVIAPNVHRFVRVKKDIHGSLGLAKRGGVHHEPHNHPEMITLLATCEREETHSFVEGRTYGGDKTKVDHFGKGIARLRDGKLQAWVTESTRARELNPPSAAQTSQSTFETHQNTSDAVVFIPDDDEMTQDPEDDDDPVAFTRGSMHMENGQFIIDTLDDDDDDLPLSPLGDMIDRGNDVEMGEGGDGDDEVETEAEDEEGRMILGQEENGDWDLDEPLEWEA